METLDIKQDFGDSQLVSCGFGTTADEEGMLRSVAISCPGFIFQCRSDIQDDVGWMVFMSMARPGMTGEISTEYIEHWSAFTQVFYRFPHSSMGEDMAWMPIFTIDTMGEYCCRLGRLEEMRPVSAPVWSNEV